MFIQENNAICDKFSHYINDTIHAHPRSSYNNHNIKQLFWKYTRLYIQQYNLLLSVVLFALNVSGEGLFYAQC